MRHIIAGKVSCLALALLASTAPAGTAQWGYQGAVGPEHWAELDPGFGLCATGKNQSPIDLAGFIESDLDPLNFDYPNTVTKVVNDGRGILAKFAPGASIEVDGRPFRLRELRLHAPSEHRLEGRTYPVEAQLVHTDAAGNVAIVVVLWDEGEDSPAVARLLRMLQDRSGAGGSPTAPVRTRDLLPEDERTYYRYNGSLTTPPCTEGVRWLVMKEPTTLSKEQLEQLTRIIGHADSRPVQPVYARPVLE